MITTLRPVLRAAKRHGYAVGAFNISNLEEVQAVVGAAEDQRSPVIVAVSESGWKYGGVALLAATRALAEAAPVPVVIHLDHGHSLPLVSSLLPAGFSSVMMDASALSLRENIIQTGSIVDQAHRRRISVEGEIGTIGGSEDAAGVPQIIYPTPDDVALFVKKTGVDAVAVGLGTSHGLPVKDEHVEYELLTAITERITVPLVLHGASNLPPATIRAAIRKGICKINIDTELRQTFTQTVREYLRRHPDEFDPRQYLGLAREAVQNHIIQVLRLFGSVNHAADAGSRRW